MHYKLIILSLFVFSYNIYGQEIESNSKKLETLDWDIMYCGRTKIEEKKPCTLYVKNETDYPIQGYWLNNFNTLTKVGFGRIEPNEIKKLNIKANEYWVFGDLDNNALGVFQTTSGVNEIVIDESNFKKSVKLPKNIEDRSILGTPSGGEILIEQESYDVLHYDLRLEIFPKNQYIEGSNTITAKVLEELNDFVFDLDSLLTIENVYLKKNNRKIKLPVETIDGKHWCKLPTASKKGELIIVDIEYCGNPRIATHAPYQGGFSWNKTEDCKPWIATSCQVDGADLWLPCKDYQWDEPETVNLSFTVPDGLKAISNGVLISEIKNKNETVTFNWKVANPINNYGISLNIAPYKYIPDSYKSITNEKIDLGYWVLPENESTAKEFYGNSKKYLNFIESTIGPYPFRNEKLGIVEVPFIGMEHQTVIAFGPNTSTKYSGYNSVLFHEICHEWFGNLVTASEWKDLWIHESLDAYMEALYEEFIEGEGAYKQKVASFSRNLQNKVSLSPKKTMNSRELHDYYVYKEEGIISSKKNQDVYKKGGYLLHTLRGLIGKQNILKFLHLMAYPNKDLESNTNGSQCRFTTTDEFFSILNKVSGQNLNWFKEVYFRNPALPKLSVTENKKGVLLKWIIKENINFPMPLELKTKDGIIKVEFKNNLAQLEIKREEILEIDPNKWVLFVTSK